MRREEILYTHLKNAFLDRGFLKDLGSSRRKMEQTLAALPLQEMAAELTDLTPDGERFRGAAVCDAASAYFHILSDAPEEGWLPYCYQTILHHLFPALGLEEDPKYREGRLILLQLLTGIYAFERETLPFDPTRDMIFLSDAEVDEHGFTREYPHLHRLVRSNYVYAFMRIGTEITPFNTLGHISGVHYVAMHAARQLRATGVPVDLAIVSGAAAGHDIGKYGCRKSEERRIPYLHYYYTDRCFRRFDLPTIGYIAANHSTWDLELENLSVESLLLIYADFRVKSSRTTEGEVVHFYTLKESYDVILGKLDNVDEAKALRYQKVYNKLADFEQYMAARGVSTDLPDVPVPYPPAPAEKPNPETLLLEGEECIQQVKFIAIDHNIRLMSRFHDDAQFGNLIEAARSETHWKNLRTYISILGEYSTYMTETQKMMTMRFLYEMLTNKESDIRTQASGFLGQIVGTYNDEYKKELPEGEVLPDKAVTNVSLFASYLDRIFRPHYKLTDQHKIWISNCMNSFVNAVVTSCRQDCRYKYINILLDYYRRTDYNKNDYLLLLKVITILTPDQLDEEGLQTLHRFLEAAENSRSRTIRTAAVLAGGSLFPDYRGEAQIEKLIHILDMPEDAESFANRLNTMFLDDLKAGTSWVIKLANIRLMLRYLESTDTPGDLLHVATHLSNLVKVSERVTVRKTAGEALLTIVDRLSTQQRNELAVEMYNGLDIGDYQFSRYIPDYLGILLLRLPPNELDEVLASLTGNLGSGNGKLADASINTLGVLLENYASYQGRFGESEEAFERRENTILFALIKAFAYYDSPISREAFWVLGHHLFESRILSLSQKRDLYSHCFKKIMSLLVEKKETALDFYNNAAVLNNIYRFVSAYNVEYGAFGFAVNQKVAFYPGTFDPFSLGHKAVARTIRDMGFDVYLALDEFSWSKNTQPRLQRRKIMNMSVADEESIFPFPDDFSVNIANDDDVRKLRETFAGKDLYIAVGSDVVEHASCYRNPPSEYSIHGMNHIIFERESDEDERSGAPQQRYPITGDILHLTLKKYYEDISSTRIRDNIDRNRDISNLIDPVAQNYIYDRNLYLREPAYKHVLQAQDISISPYANHGADGLNPFMKELQAAGYKQENVQNYLARPGVRSLTISSMGRGTKVVACAAAHRLETSELLQEFGDLSVATHIREQAAGSIGVIGLLHSAKSRRVSNINQIIITEILTELLSRDFAYAVYHPVDEAGNNPRIIEALKRQGFENITEERGASPVYAVNMRSPVVCFRDVETVIKNPFNKNPRVLHAIDEAHSELLRLMTHLYPGQLVLSFNTSAVHNKIIAKVAAINGVSQIQDKNGRRGPYMSVPFGKALADVLVPNTVTKALKTEKYFHRDLVGFTIGESRYYSPLETQAQMIRSFNRPVILIDDLLHSGNRMRIIDPILRENNVDVKEIVVGVMTGSARDAIELSGRKVESAYFLPTLRIWLNERDCYPFIGGDSIEGDSPEATNRNSSVNLILPYTAPQFIADGDSDGIYQYSMTCLRNARRIWAAIEEEYQRTFERRLTLKSIGEVITYPRTPDLGEGIHLDENLAPTAFIDNAIERLIRLKWRKHR